MQPNSYYQRNAILFYISVILIFMVSACVANKKQETIQPTATLIISPTKAENAIIPKNETPTPDLATSITSPMQDSDSYSDALLPDCYDTELSPNKEWATGYCGYDETWIISTDQTAKWTISYGEYYGSKVNSGNGSITPEYWTADGKYLYLVIQRGVSGPIYFANGWGVIRLDLENGQYFDVLEPLQKGFYSFSFSADGEQLAYIYQSREPMVLKIVSLKSEDTKSIVLNPQYNQAGELIWSPDKSKIAAAQAIVDYEGSKPDLFSVAIIDLENQSLRIIIQDNPLEMTPKIWLDENTIELVDMESKTWVFDLSTNILLEK